MLEYSVGESLKESNSHYDVPRTRSGDCNRKVGWWRSAHPKFTVADQHHRLFLCSFLSLSVISILLAPPFSSLSSLDSFRPLFAPPTLSIPYFERLSCIRFYREEAHHQRPPQSLGSSHTPRSCHIRSTGLLGLSSPSYLHTIYFNYYLSTSGFRL
ncbi:uncharacterized protein BDV17DRAFT_180618 [Aspergillus undulatus]|uniref:uncharacterized protein n=1 Tax=Aspergillus undulatus TaxID=1810928 RepID=UPI003CCE34F4